jgi:hypothetical protein
MLRLFKQSVSSPLSGFVLHAPKNKTSEVGSKQPADPLSQDGQVPRRSPKLKKLVKKKPQSEGKNMCRLAQDLVAKKCGVLKDDDTLDALTM